MEWLLVPDGLVWVFQKLLIYWAFHAQPSLGFTEKTIKYPVSGGCEEQKCLVDVRGQRRMGRLVRDDRKATVTQITNHYNQGMQNTSLNAQQVEPWSRWSTAAEDHTGCHSCQLRTGNGGYNSHRLTKIGQKKNRKTLPGLMSLDFCCDIQMVGSEFGVKNIRAWIHPALSQRFRLLVVV